MQQELIPGLPFPARVRVDAEIEDLIPAFIANRRSDVENLRQALERGDEDAVRRIGHTMKGVGGAYGFDHITEVGALLEQLAPASRAAEIERCLAHLSAFLDTVEVEYV